MSVEARRWYAALVLTFAGTALAQQAPAEAPQADAPDLALLEYLGRWEESDEDWLLVSGLQDDEQATETEHRDDDTATDKNAVAEQDDEE